MKISHFLIAVTALAMAFLFTFAVPSATAEDGPTTKVIKSVDATANTVEIQFTRGEKTVTHSYTLNASATITVNGATGTLAQVKVGMTVSSFGPRESTTLDTLVVTDSGASSGSK